MSEKMRVVIGYDGYPASIYIFEDLKRAGLPEKLEAVVVTSAEFEIPTLVEAVGSSQAAILDDIEAARKKSMEDAQTTANAAKDSLQTLFPGWKVTTVASGESPTWAVVNKAENWKAHLIVVGARRHMSLGRFLGSVSQSVLIHAPCSVRISRPPFEPARLQRKIVVGVDGSPEAEKAITTVGLRHWPASSEARVFVGLPHKIVAHFPVPVPSGEGSKRFAINKMAASYAAKISSANLTASAYVREGDPKEMLLNEAENWKADCIYVGARGLSPTRRFLMGSNSMAVAARAHCSVEVVR